MKFSVVCIISDRIVGQYNEFWDAYDHAMRLNNESSMQYRVRKNHWAFA